MNIDNVYVIDAKVTNSEGDSVTVFVSSQYAPITPEWKKAYRPVALDLAAAHIPILSSGMRVQWVETRV